MKYLKKIWIRILLSLFIGGMVAETFHIKLGEISPQTSTTLVWIGAGVSFGLLSLIVWINKYRYYFFPPKEKEDDILNNDN